MMIFPLSRSLAAAADSSLLLHFAASILFLVCFATTLTSAASQTLLPNDEVDALRQIGKTLGKTNWNFNVDPCSGNSGWVTQVAPGQKPDNQVLCGECSADNTTCHIISIILKSQNLSGNLPPEFVSLPYLLHIDLTRNYLDGTLPPQWASMKLVNQISLLANRLTGPIPKEYGSITTLEILELDANQLFGAIPQELGNLPVIWRITLSSNQFTGELPDTLAKLSTLQDFRISDNSFTGKIPNFIQNWTNLQRLGIQASGLDGPIPSVFGLMSNLTDLRISDLNGTEGTFPTLNNKSLNSFTTLVLRSCSIVGQLPEYLGEMKNLQVLDLSFNKLSGNIPSTMANLSTVNYIYLTGNLLSGPLPNWTLGGHNIDLSYNNLTLGSSEDSNCQKDGLNLFGSSSKRNPSGKVTCLTSNTCSGYANSFYINCGGPEEYVGGNRYESDLQSIGPSTFYHTSYWASSSTGSFMDDKGQNIYLGNATKQFNGDDFKILKNARLSPLSLTYYGFCLLNGKYTVKLHFAEIMFTDDPTFGSLGRRLFDVYIQGKLMLKDFNIEDKAHGVNNEFIQKLPATVDNNTLEIRFYWAGKGTTLIPTNGVYGPIISAISVEREKGNVISAGTVVWILFAVASAIFLVVGILWWKGCLSRKDTLESEMKGLDLHTGSFTLRQIRAATNNFDKTNKIGEGGFGPVYKGYLDGTVIAVKQLSSKSKQGNREFLNEIGMISALQHPNLVKLYGCCIEGNELMLVYEFMENNSLARALFGPEEHRLELNWSTRHKICVGIARGLAHLHEESRLKIVHRDIKATNVLLDKDLNPKISDFGLAKLDEEENTHISTRIAGTYGYMAPEYAMRGYLTDKADVYSFGIVALEIVSGKSNTSSRPKQEPFYLLEWANSLKDEGNLMELVDPRLGSEFDEKEVMTMINIGFLCTNVSSTERPAMSSVVSILEGRASIQEFGSIIITNIPNAMKSKNQHQESHVSSSSDSQVQSTYIDGSWTTTASTSAADLYPVNLDSVYMLKDDSSGR